MGCASQPGAAAGGKKTEFPVAEPVAAAMDRLDQGRMRLTPLFGDSALPVLVPPWNRISAPGLVPALVRRRVIGPEPVRRPVPWSRSQRSGAGQHPRGRDRLERVPGFRRGGCRAGAGGPAHLQARRTGTADAGEPTGWLSHHAVHDAATWSFLEQLMAATTRAGNLWSGAARRSCSLIPDGPGAGARADACSGHCRWPAQSNDSSLLYSARTGSRAKVPQGVCTKNYKWWRSFRPTPGGRSASHTTQRAWQTF